MDKKLLFIINPMAGRGGYKNALGDVLETFSAAGYLPSVYLTQRRGDATRLAAEYASGFETVVCMGGDGTLSETVAGLMRAENPPSLGYIPLGTTNDVAATLSIPRNPVKAAEMILNGTPTPIDVGGFGDNGYFTYIAAFGAFTSVSYETPQEIKHNLGYLAYVLEGMKYLARATSVKTQIEYNGMTLREDVIFCAVTNSTSVAGLLKLRDSDVALNDGLFEVILVRNPRKLSDLNAIAADIISRSYASDSILVLHSGRIRFSFKEPVRWTRDGEDGGSHKDITLVNKHRALTLLV